MSEEPCCCVKLAIAVNDVVAEGGVDVGRGEGWVAGSVQRELVLTFREEKS